jgi:ubiquinone/menaquinone biosynthesis C-methylase UbiE
VVGRAGNPSADAAGLSASVADETRAAYDAASPGWEAGPGRMYRDLAAALVACAGVPVPGQRVLDLGAGTGAAGAAALEAGAAEVVAADLAPGMLARCPACLRPVAADAAALPFRDRSFGVTLAAFCIGHLPDVAACLAEVRRVSRAVAVSSFASGWSHPAKGAVDNVLAEFGYQAPDWYLTFKQQTEPRSQDPALLQGQLSSAGFIDIGVRTLPVRTGVETPGQLAAWRLGMAHVAPFVGALPAGAQVALRAAAEAAVGRLEHGLVVSMLVLTATSPP